MAHFWFNFKNRFVKPFNKGYLPEKDGHRIYFQEVGNPKGEPVIVFHGGPGSSSSISNSYSYNRKKYRIILFDQRGCGQTQSKDPFFRNTIQDTIKDASRLLDYLRIKEKVIAAGCSWGSTCAIHFAETYPAKVKQIIVNAIFLGRKKDAENITPVTALFYPDALDTLKSMAKKESIDRYFHKLAFSKNKQDYSKAMQYYKYIDEMTFRTDLSVNFSKKKFTDEDLQEFRIYMHYQTHDFFLKSNQLIKEANKISKIPTEIYQNRWDPCCPPYQAYELHKALPHSKLHLLPSRGHISDMMFWQMYVDNMNNYKS